MVLMPALEYRTRIRKNRATGVWILDYWIPYSGFLRAEFPTWDEALADAIVIETEKAWM